ncbi:MAG TPA: hypothetical protein H9992_04060 [Candidatus Prevotella intestinigallinarum]|nr:hypothetical protein [Candidatus Prevotella intestinigallinarum]
MSDKGKARRAAYEAQQEKKAKRVVNWIFVALVLLAILYIIYTFGIVS